MRGSWLRARTDRWSMYRKLLQTPLPLTMSGERARTMTRRAAHKRPAFTLQRREVSFLFSRLWKCVESNAPKRCDVPILTGECHFWCLIYKNYYESEANFTPFVSLFLFMLWRWVLSYPRAFLWISFFISLFACAYFDFQLIWSDQIYKNGLCRRASNCVPLF